MTADHLTLNGTTKRWFDVADSSLSLADSYFCPAEDVEPLRVSGTPTNGFFILARNVFGPTTGPHDVCHYTGGGAGPVAQFYDNVFLGASDDMLDLDGTVAHIEGNLFLHARKGHAETDAASAISGGRGGPSAFTIARNIFHDCDYGALCEATNFCTIQNNTFLGMIHAAVAFDEPLRRGEGVTPGLGALLEGNIVWGAASNFGGVQVNDPVWGTTLLAGDRNLFQASDFVTNGAGNLRLDPRFVNTNGAQAAETIRSNLALLAGSPAIGAGPNGLDLGALVPAGASISPVASPTAQTQLTLTIAGPGIVAYRASLNGDGYGTTNAIAVPLTLANLPAGTNTLSVIGRNCAGVWQTNASVRAWECVTGFASVALSEVLADNGGAYGAEGGFRDVVELHNPGNLPFELSGCGLSDDAALPFKFVFAPGSSIGPGQYLLLFGGGPLGTNLNLGFNVNRNGGGLWLTAPAGAGGAVLDALAYGFQLPALSVSRLSGEWKLSKPTIGASNLAEPTGVRSRVRINEWLAASVAVADFIELYNSDSLPVDLGGCCLTDSPEGWPAQFRLPPLHFLPASSPFVFTADGDTNNGPSHLNFKLDPEWGTIGLFAPDLSLIDLVQYGPQAADVSMGRSPDAAQALATFPTPTPGSGNPASAGAACSVTTTTVRPLAYTNVWRFQQTNSLDGVAWQAANHNDAGWPSGPGLLAFENDAAITALVRTVLQDPRLATNGLVAGHATYFRTSFVLASNPANAALSATLRLDDGAIIYLNGAEALRVRMGAGTVTNGTPAVGTPPGTNGDATVDELFAIATNNLVAGTNVIAVEVHPSGATDGDIVFGLALDVVRTVTNCAGAYVALNEVMANNRGHTNADGTVTDWVELVNPTSFPADLSDLSLSDDTLNPRRWVFPSNTVLAAGAHLVVRFDSSAPATTAAAPVLNTGFGMDSDGDKVLLYNRPAGGGALIDAVTFGAQALDYTIGRFPNATGSWTIALPTPAAANLAASTAPASGLRMNEWMASPSSGEDWFEIHNPAAQPVAIGGCHLTDNLNNQSLYAIPALSFIGSGLHGAYIRFYADNLPALGAIHCKFKLNGNAGTSIGLFQPDGISKIDSVTFGPQASGVAEGFFPDGATNLMRFPRTPTPGSANALPFTDVVINEALPRPAGGPQLVELRNPSEQAVDLSGWWLSDSVFEPKKYRLPDPVILMPGAVLTIPDTAFNPPPGVPPAFALRSTQGGGLYLSVADPAGNLTGLRASADYGDTDAEVAFGHFDTSVGPQFVAMSAQSFGATNPYPQVGPVVINEIHYHPAALGTNDGTLDEFVELLNITGSSVPLCDPAASTNTWHVRNAVRYDFPANSSLPANGFALLVGFDPATNPAQAAAFQAKFGVPAGVPLYGPWDGKLNNGGETVELNRPAAPTNGVVPRPLVDRVAYDSGAPWPAAADGGGGGPSYSLQRKVPAQFGNDPVNWIAGAVSAGAANQPAAGVAPGVANQPADRTVAAGGSAGFTTVASGASPFTYQWLQNGCEIPGASNSTYSVTNVAWSDTGRYAVRIANAWGCALSSNAWLRIAEPPVILRQPAAATVAAGAPVAFEVVARGTPPLAYQWRLNSTNIPAGNAAPWALAAASAADAGNYGVQVSNGFGTTNSLAALLTVIVSDRDADGTPDWWELGSGTNPDVPDAEEDPDGDLTSNLAEYLAGTDPLDPASRFAVETILTVGTNALCTFTAVSNHGYTVQFSDVLQNGGAWQPLQHVAAAATSRTVQIVTGAASNRFYRVVTPQAP